MKPLNYFQNGFGLFGIDDYDKPLAVVEAYVKENTTEIVDPLDVSKKVDALKEKQETLLTELDTGIKVSNATTFIEF